jgi:hypothetical protein
MIETIRIDRRKLGLMRGYNWIVSSKVTILAIPPIANVSVGNVDAWVAALIVLRCCRIALARIFNRSCAIENRSEKIDWA